MAIDPKKGGKCWSCKYCEDVGFESEYDSVYKRKCNYPGKSYVDDCTKYCSAYVWDRKDPDFDYTPSSSSSSSSYSSSSSSSSGSSDSSGCSTGCIVSAIVAVVIVVALAVILTKGIVPFGAKDASPEISSSETSSTVYMATATVKASSLNMREGASTDYDVIIAIKNGETVNVIETKDGWAHVEYNGQTGWCSEKYLEMN